MATKVASNPRRCSNASGVLMEVRKVLTDGDATWKAGEFLRSGADGLLYECTTGTASGVGADAINFYALTTLGTAITADTTYSTVGVVHDDDVFEMNELDGAVTGAMIGNWYDLSVSSNLCTVNVGSSAHAVFELINPKWRVEPLGNTSADTLALVYVKVLGRSLHAAKV